MKKKLFSLSILLSGWISGFCQTSVSGGIYTNTTWTKAAGPYLVTDTVVVFPGLTLTIEPGTLILFADNKVIELRESSLMAEGTSTDPIVFYCAPGAPSDQLYFNKGTNKSSFNYCRFEYAGTSIIYKADGILNIKNSLFTNNHTGVLAKDVKGVYTIDSCDFIHHTDCAVNLNNRFGELSVNHSNFKHNLTGISGLYGNGRISNSTIDSNQLGLYLHRLTVENCHIGYNDKGLVSSSTNKIINCVIEHNVLSGISANGDSVLNCVIRGNETGLIASVSVVIGNIIDSNETGIYDSAGWGGSVVVGNTISHCNIALDNILEPFYISRNIIEDNNTSIVLADTTSVISCNKICSSSVNDIIYLGKFNVKMADNFWCTTDSADVAVRVTDGYDDPTYGLVHFMPMDTTGCYLGVPTKVKTIAVGNSVNLFPNPFSQFAQLQFDNPENSPHVLNIYNAIGQKVMVIDPVISGAVLINRGNLSEGIYFYQLHNPDGLIARGRFIIQ